MGKIHSVAPESWTYLSNFQIWSIQSNFTLVFGSHQNLEITKTLSSPMINYELQKENNLLALGFQFYTIYMIQTSRGRGKGRNEYE